MKPVFALVDCNNFYISCERIFKADLRDKPVVVVGNNDGRIIARSQEVKDLGIAMGAPLFACKKMIEQHGVVVFSSNYALYQDLSERTMRLLSRFTPRLEVASITPTRWWIGKRH
jgi:DNA polymerase V